MLLLMSVAAQAQAFGFADLVTQARQLASQPYQPPRQVAPSLGQLTYDDYRAINYKPSHELWPKSRFHVQFFAPGYRFTTPVAINIIDADGVHPQYFDPNDFNGGGVYPHDLPNKIGFAGFRLHVDSYDPQQNVDTKNNELIAFLGASYFRAKAAGEQYGVSARGLAIDTIAKGPEEFPQFREFWIKKPTIDATSVTVYALLDSPSATGAYRFDITPGNPASVTVSVTLFLRQAVHELGLAAFSSMYLYGRGDHRPTAYLRPAVHDSQGLLIRDAQNRWTWRPLTNPQKVRQYSFTLDNPKGFGLLQRNRDPFVYQSPSMAYQSRPSVWVEPLDDWGAGQVQLVEIPSDAEYNDNIALFWTPATQPKPLQPFHYSYRLLWGDAVPQEPQARVTNTLATRHSLTQPTTFMLDFSGDKLTAEQLATAIKANIQVGDNGKLVDQRLRRIGDDSYRLTFTIAPLNGHPIQLRAYLSGNVHALSETWDYVITPARHPISSP